MRWHVRGEDTALLILGDKKAWDGFVERASPVIYSAVRRVLAAHLRALNEADAAEIVQTVFVRLVRDDYRLLRTYDPSRAALSTWLTIVARSSALDSLRRRRPETVSLDEHAIDIPGESRPPELPLDVPRGLLSPRQKLVLHLLFDREMDVSEVAKLLGVGAQTVRSARHKALKRLRRYFKQRG